MRSGYAAGHSPSYNAKVKNEWSYTSAPLVCLHGVERENFTICLLQIYEMKTAFNRRHYITARCVK